MPPIIDAFGRTVTVIGNSYAVPGIIITASDLASALRTLSGMAPHGWTPPAVVPTTISALDFIRRFTDAEQAGLTAANPLWGIKIAAAGMIDIADAELVADMQAAVDQGKLTQDRMTQVLDLSRASP